MTESNRDREENLRALLTSALEVQLAAFRAGIRFWEDWIEQASHFVQVASDNLRTVGSGKGASKETLLRLVDASRESIRSMIELPRSTASHFIEELDQLSARTRTSDRKRGQTEPSTDTKAGQRRTRPRRAAKVKH